MLEMMKKFFDFCDQKNRRKLYTAVVLGVFDAIFGAMKIPAAFRMKISLIFRLKQELCTGAFLKKETKLLIRFPAE